MNSGSEYLKSCSSVPTPASEMLQPNNSKQQTRISLVCQIEVVKNYSFVLTLHQIENYLCVLL